jgi:hypothetical protein
MPLSVAEFVGTLESHCPHRRFRRAIALYRPLRSPGTATPAAADHIGDTFTFEKHDSKLHGGMGFADVWKRGFFAWEDKGKHQDLVAAYHQLADYRDELENPPLLVVYDMDVFKVQTSFTGTQTRDYRFILDDLLTAASFPNSALPPAGRVSRAVH